MTNYLKAAMEACRAPCRGCDRDEPGCDSSICERCHNTGYTIPPAALALARAVREAAAQACGKALVCAEKIRAIDLGDKGEA